MRPIGSDAYQYLHKQIVVQLVYFCIMMLNSVPAVKGISNCFAPREIVCVSLGPSRNWQGSQ
eukprot:4473642-Ditylum_brightwellii.AAC.1